MRITISIFIISFLLVACQLTPNALGDKFAIAETYNVDDFLSALKDKKHIENAQIEGTIYKTCLSEGCWFMIQDKDKHEIILRIKDKQFRMPNTSADKKAVVLLDAKIIDSTYQNNEWYALEVKGIQFK